MTGHYESLIAGSNPTVVCTVARSLSLWAMGEELVHCWDRRGLNLRTYF